MNWKLFVNNEAKQKCPDGLKNAGKNSNKHGNANMNKTKIKSVKYVGSLPTMDLEMENKSHTFFANGLATSNSHSVEYSVISYWDGWLKYHYPLQFFASYLTYAADDKKKQIMQDILDRGITVQLPKIGISKANRWQVDQQQLIMPFTEIVGVGENTAIQIEESGKKKRMGFFGNQALQVSSKTQKILQDIKAFDRNYEFSYKELEKMRSYFLYDPCTLFFDE